MKTVLRDQFNHFHASHPEVYNEFKRRTQQLWDRGIRHYSADGILHIIRFHTTIDGRDKEPFKINNNYSSFYARLYADDFPGRSAFFSTRIQKNISIPQTSYIQ